MFENIANFFRKLMKSEKKEPGSGDAAKERLHLVLMQDRANVSADFLELMKQEIIEVIKKYIEVDEKEIDVRLTNKENEDGTNGAPALYANIPILNIRNEMKKEVMTEKKGEKVESNEGTSVASTEEMQENQNNEEMKQENVDVGATIGSPEEIKTEEVEVVEQNSETESNVEACSGEQCSSVAGTEETQEKTENSDVQNIEEQNVETVSESVEVVNQTNNM